MYDINLELIKIANLYNYFVKISLTLSIFSLKNKYLVISIYLFRKNVIDLFEIDIRK